MPSSSFERKLDGDHGTVVYSGWTGFEDMVEVFRCVAVNFVMGDFTRFSFPSSFIEKLERESEVEYHNKTSKYTIINTRPVLD